jgi:ribonuclease MRP protein subunit SNM1
MLSPTTTAKLKHLNDSAHFLAFSAPSTAAFMQSRYDRIVDEEGAVVSDSRRREVCSACGFNMLWSPTYLPVKLEMESKKLKRSNRDVSSRPDGTKKTVLSCRMCHSKTEHELPVAKRARRASKLRKIHLTTESNKPSDVLAQNKINKPSSDSHANAPKKRAKGRKQNSLSAMLAKSKAEAASQRTGFGLDLMDLMKGA